MSIILFCVLVGVSCQLSGYDCDEFIAPLVEDFVLPGAKDALVSSSINDILTVECLNEEGLCLFAEMSQDTCCYAVWRLIDLQSEHPT